MLTGDAPIVISSQILNRQDGMDEYRMPQHVAGDDRRPPQGRGLRRARAGAAGQLIHRGRMLLGYQCATPG